MDLGEADREAAKLSKQTGTPVFSFMYFDDDLMSLKLFKDGKKLAHYETFYEREPYIKNCGEFLGAAGLDAAMEGRLKKILKCEDLERKVGMLQELLGVAFYINTEFIKEGTERYKLMRGDSAYRDYDEEKKRQSKIKNKTKVVLMQEIDAKLSFFRNQHEANYNFFLLSYRDKEGIYSCNADMVELAGDAFEPIFNNVDIRVYSSMYPGKDGWTFCNDIGIRKKCVRLDKDFGNSVEAVLPENIHIDNVTEDGNIICVTYIEPKNLEKSMSIIKVGITGEIDWRYEAGGYSDIRHVVVHKGCTYAYVEHNGEIKYNEIIRLSPKGELLSQIEIASYTERLFFLGDFLYYLENRYAQGIEQVITKATESLECVISAALPKGVSIYNINVFNNDGILYCDALYDKTDKTVCINAKTLEYVMIDRDPNMFLYFADGGMLYYVAGISTLCILGSEYKMISRHRLKGNILRVCKTETGIHVVTGTGNLAAWGFPEPPCTARVYRIDPA